MFLDFLQVQELTDIASRDDFTVVGILMACNIISISVAIFFYREKKKLSDEYIQELKRQDTTMSKVVDELKAQIKDYNRFTENLTKLKNL